MDGKRVRIVSVFLGVAALLPLSPATGQTDAHARRRSEMLRTIEVWIECEECTAEQRRAVARLGSAAVPLLAEHLRSGPPAEKRETGRRQLLATYKSMKDYEASHPKNKVAMTEEEYVKTYLDNYVALYHVRAATALADIGGADAIRLLEEALQAQLRDDVKASVRASLERLKKRKGPP